MLLYHIKKQDYTALIKGKPAKAFVEYLVLIGMLLIY